MEPKKPHNSLITLPISPNSPPKTDEPDHQYSKNTSWHERHKRKCKERITLILDTILPHIEGMLLHNKIDSPKTKCISKYLIDTLLNLRKKLGLIEILLNFEDISDCMEGIQRISSELEISQQQAMNLNVCSLAFYLKHAIDEIFMPILIKVVGRFDEITICRRFLILNRKIQIVAKFLTKTLEVPMNDIFSQGKDSQIWQELDKFSSEIYCGTEKEIRDTTEKDNDFLMNIMAAYVKYTKSAINLEKVDQKMLHHIINMPFEDCDKLKTILNSKESNVINNIAKKLKAEETSVQLGSKFWKLLFSMMMKNRDEVIEECDLFNCYPNSIVITEFWNIAEHYVSKIARNLTLEKIKTNAKFHINSDLLGNLVEDISKPFITVCCKKEIIDNKVKLKNDRVEIMVNCFESGVENDDEICSFDKKINDAYNGTCTPCNKKNTSDPNKDSNNTKFDSPPVKIKITKQNQDIIKEELDNISVKNKNSKIEKDYKPKVSLDNVMFN